jgi:Methane/Phenol/Toluene Hydroxylase
MTEGRPPRPKPRLKTWSSLGQLGRIPSEYEIVTHNLNYTTRSNRTSALESNPTTPANMWFLTYRDKSPLQADDWRGFRDPDQITYRKYVTIQDEQETAVERVLDEYGPAGHDASLPGWWVECPGNRDVLQRWVARWTPRAEAAAAGLGQLFGQLPSGVARQTLWRTPPTQPGAGYSTRRGSPDRTISCQRGRW